MSLQVTQILSILFLEKHFFGENCYIDQWHDSWIIISQLADCVISEYGVQ
jgi:hypothetical protein